MKTKITISFAFFAFVLLTFVSCLSSEERKLVGTWHQKSQYTKDYWTFFYEGNDKYTEDKCMSSSGKFTCQFNIGEDGYNYIVYCTTKFKSSGTWSIVDGDKLISKNDEVNFSEVQVSSNIELDDDAVQKFKEEFKSEILSYLRDESLKKDTTEIVLLTDKEYKYKGVDGTVYTMTRVN